MPDFRDLISRMADGLDHYRQLLMDDRRETHALAAEARAALAEPEPEGPTDEEIMELMPQQMRDDWAAAARALAVFDPDHIIEASVFRLILNRHSVDHARAVLARWGRPAPEPVPEKSKGRVCINNPVQIAECGGPCLESGPDACDCVALWRDQPAPPPKEEVAKIVDSLRRHARAAAGTRWAPLFIRAANLLERLSPQPH